MKINTVEDLLDQGRAARAASRALARLSTKVKNRALLNIAEGLENHQKEVLAANEKDCLAARADGLNEAMPSGFKESPMTCVAWLPSPIQWARHWI